MNAASPSGGTHSSIPGIQMMRGIAAFMVVLHHAWLATEHSGAPPGLVAKQLIGVGAAGVDIFFVISGFIMIYVSRGRFGQPGAGPEFLVKRAIRIVPLYWIISTGLLTAWLAGLYLRDEHLSGADMVCSYLFAPCVHPHGPEQTTHPLLDQGWTLSYEWYFYLLFACWLAIGSMRSLVLTAPAFFGAVIALATHLRIHGPVALFLSDPVVFEFCFGLLIGFLYLQGLRLPPRGSALLVGIGVLALLVCELPDRSLRWLIWGIPAALITLGMLYVRAPATAGGRALVRLGDASYSLYLIHGVITMTFDHYLGMVTPAPGIAGKCAYVLLMCVLSVIGGVLLHRLLERPVTAFLQSWYAQRIVAKCALSPKDRHALI